MAGAVHGLTSLLKCLCHLPCNLIEYNVTKLSVEQRTKLEHHLMCEYGWEGGREGGRECEWGREGWREGGIMYSTE